MKRIAVVLMMIVAFAVLVMSGCMPMTGAGGAEGDPTAPGGMLGGILPLILIVAVFYFILIRPQNKKNKQVAQMRDAIKRGDWVTTIGGFKGRVSKVKDDTLIIEVGTDKVKLEIMRWGISKIDDAAPERKTTKKDVEKEDEEEAPKRKPKKLAPAAKKEEEPAAEDDAIGDDAEDGDDEE